MFANINWLVTDSQNVDISQFSILHTSLSLSSWCNIQGIDLQVSVTIFEHTSKTCTADQEKENKNCEKQDNNSIHQIHFKKSVGTDNSNE